MVFALDKSYSEEEEEEEVEVEKKKPNNIKEVFAL